jgi:hypothetical protein
MKIKMKIEDYIKCIISILNFLENCDDEYRKFNCFNTPSNLNMIKVLDDYGYSMTSFAEFLSKEKLWENHAKEFFSDENKSLLFFRLKLNEYKTLLRQYKLKRILQNELF